MDNNKHSSLEGNSAFKEEPILLLTGEKTLEISYEGIQFLTSIKEKKVAILTIVGPPSSGKSFLLDQLLGTKKGFQELADNKPKIRGLYIWGKPIKMENEDLYILIIDSDGFSQKNIPSRQDKQFFMLATLLSSSVIYNSNREVSVEIDYFSKFCEDVQRITTENNRKITNNYLPELLWVNRDFQNKEKNPSKLSTIFEEKVKSNDIINSLFSNRKCFYLNSPLSDDKMKQKLYTNTKEELLPDYKMHFHRIKKYIFENIKPKRIMNVNINGKLLYGLLQEYSEIIKIGEQYPSIHNSLETVLLSTAKEISEDLISNNTKKLKDILTPSNNISELYKKLMQNIEEEITLFCTSSIGGILFAKDVNTYIKLIFSSITSEFDKHIEKCLTKYDKNINSFIQRQEKKEQIKSLDKINQYFYTFSSELRSQLVNNILGFNAFKFNDKLMRAVDDYVCSKIKALGENMEMLLEGMLNENKNLKDLLNQQENLLTERNKEINEKGLTILELQSKNEKMLLDSNSKEKEYLNNLSIANKKLENTKSQYKEIIDEKDKRIKELEDKIESLNKEISTLNKENKQRSNDLKKLQIELEGYKGQECNSHSSNTILLNSKYSKMDFKISNMKAIFNTIRATFIEYKDSVDKIDKEKDSVFQTRSMEISIKEVEERNKKWQEDFRAFIEEQIKSINDNYEGLITKAKDQISSLSFEITKLNYTLNDEKQNYSVLQSKYEESKKEVQEYKKISSVKDSLIGTQKEAIRLYQDKISEYKQTQENLEVALNQNIVGYKMKEDEIHTLVLVVQNIFSKKKEHYEFNLQKLSNEIKSEISKLVRDFKIFK